VDEDIMDVSSSARISSLHQVRGGDRAELENVHDVLVHIEPYGDDMSREKFGVSKENLSTLKGKKPNSKF